MGEDSEASIQAKKRPFDWGYCSTRYLAVYQVGSAEAAILIDIES